MSTCKSSVVTSSNFHYVQISHLDNCPTLINDYIAVDCSALVLVCIYSVHLWYVEE